VFREQVNWIGSSPNFSTSAAILDPDARRKASCDHPMTLGFRFAAARTAMLSYMPLPFHQTLNMPKLGEGQIYRRAEVERYIGTQDGTSDFDVAKAHFPRSLESWHTDCRGWRDDDEMLLQYQVYPLARFKQQIVGLAKTFEQFDEHRNRIEAVVEIFKRGDLVYPVFLQQNDPQQRIIEGMHRSVALLQLECPCLPAFLTGYGNWFTPDQPLASFDREDEIAPAPLQEACGFSWTPPASTTRGPSQRYLEVTGCDFAIRRSWQSIRAALSGP
jgi:hypothetical protein